jgi:signal transduction histidine kinase
MSGLATQLVNLRPHLIRRALNDLARGEIVRTSLEAEVVRFYDRLDEAIASGSLEWLYTLMAEWVAARPQATSGERQSLVPLLHALRRATWSVLRDELAPAQAVEAIVTLEELFAAASLRLSQIEYEARVAAIEAELAAARVEMERLDKSKSDFIALAAHELKTPLTLIESYAQLLSNELPLDQLPRVDVHLRGLDNGARRLKEIVEDMIDVSLIDNNLLALHYEPVRLKGLMERARREFEQALRQRRLKLVIEDLDAGLTTYADPARLFQVFMNILENAIKFTPDKGRITIGSRLLPGFIELTIADTGIGIAAANHERIFARFGSLGDTEPGSGGRIKRKGRGAGLGLPLARGIIQTHGGSLWVESPGYDEQTCPGSTFHVLVPHLSEPPSDKSAKLFTPFPPVEATLQRPTPDPEHASPDA